MTTRTNAARCGTLSGYRRHKRTGEAPCDACRVALNTRFAAYQRERRRARGLRPPAACGTVSGYHRHRRTGETACDACREAYRAYHRTYRARKKSGEGT